MREGRVRGSWRARPRGDDEAWRENVTLSAAKGAMTDMVPFAALRVTTMVGRVDMDTWAMP